MENIKVKTFEQIASTNQKSEWKGSWQMQGHAPEKDQLRETWQVPSVKH